MNEQETPLEETQEESIEGLELEWPDVHAEIASACNVYNTVAEIDTAILGKKEAAKITTMRRMCLEIMNFHITQVHADIIGEGE